MLTYIFISAFIIMLASLTGVLFVWKTLGNWLAPRLRYLIALAAGVFVVIIYGLIEETLHESLSVKIIGAFLFGGIFLELVTRLLPKNLHHHHGPHPEHHHDPIDARRMMLGDAVHNIHDGLTLVPAFIVSPVVGFGTAAGILLHEMVQEISEFFVLREAGWPVKRALFWNFVMSATIFIGVALASILASVEEFARPLVAFSAGGFTYILLRDLLPSIISHAKSEKCTFSYVTALLVGVLIMGTVSVLVPHEDHHENELELPDGFGLALR